MKKLWLFILFPLFTLSAEYDPITVYLTWQRNPESTMTVQWITEKDRLDDLVEFKRPGDTVWYDVTGKHRAMPENEPYMIHRAEITGLFPETIYQFRTGKDGKIFKFKTMPADRNQPIRFLVGGDCYHGDIEVMKKTNKMAASVDPMFVMIGGDIAYAAARKAHHAKERQRRWLEWLIEWKNDMVTSDGLLIPMIVAIGNHDVMGKYHKNSSSAPFFYSLFAMPGDQGYNVLDFGNHMSIIILDSGHTHNIYGDQAHWLYHTLESRQHIPNTFAIYHVPAWPSVRKTKGKLNTQIRLHWVPIFEKFGLTTAFEHHDHAYKRTPLIYKGRIDNEKGVLYMGDGAWGVKKVRPTKNALKRWYLAKTGRERYFLMVEVDGMKRTYTAINQEGGVFDTFTH